MTPEQIQELEEKIVAQCEKRKAEGWKIKQGLDYIYNDPDGVCEACALGAFGSEEEAISYPLPYSAAGYGVIAERELGLEPGQFRSFALGFDGCARGGSTDYVFHALGQRVAARVLFERKP